jgi:hypothetical protein
VTKVVPMAAALLLLLTGCAGTKTASTHTGSSHEIFVLPGGDDGATGTRNHPLRTPQVAADRLRNGGVVHLLPGTYPRERIVLRDRHGLTIEGSSGAVLDATGLTPLDGDNGVVQIEDSSDIGVRGLGITGYRTTSLAKVPIGIYVTGHDSSITLAGNHVHNLGNDNKTLGSFDINAHGIAVYGRDPSRPISGLRISDNEVDHLHLGASESVVVNGNVHGWTVSGNRIHDVDNIGIDAIGYEGTVPGHRFETVDRARNGVIAHNTVAGVVSKGNPAYWEDGEWCNCADGIYVDGGQDIEISDNVVGTSDIGIEVGAENGRGHTDAIEVLRNKVSDSAYVGLALGGYDPKRGEVYDVRVVGNTFRDDNTLNDGSPELLLQFKLHRTTLTGNTVTATHRATPLVLQRDRPVGPAALNAGVRVEGNDYGAPVPAGRAAFIWLGRKITGFAAYQRASGQDSTSTWARR